MREEGSGGGGAKGRRGCREGAAGEGPRRYVAAGRAGALDTATCCTSGSAPPVQLAVLYAFLGPRLCSSQAACLSAANAVWRPVALPWCHEGVLAVALYLVALWGQLLAPKRRRQHSDTPPHCCATGALTATSAAGDGRWWVMDPPRLCRHGQGCRRFSLPVGPEPCTTRCGVVYCGPIYRGIITACVAHPPLSCMRHVHIHVSRFAGGRGMRMLCLQSCLCDT